eukprot:gene29693-36783_t
MSSNRSILSSEDENSLEVDAHAKIVSRTAQSESFYPTAYVQCHTLLCSINVDLVSAPRREGFFCFGLLARDAAECNIAPDLNDGIGRVVHSWGIVDRRNNTEPSGLYVEGRYVGHARSLAQGDRLSMLLDVRNTATIDGGQCHLLLNDTVIHIFTGLSSSHNLQYMFGASLCPGYAVSLRDDCDVRQLVENSLRGSVSCEDDVPISSETENRASLIGAVSPVVL